MGSSEKRTKRSRSKLGRGLNALIEAPSTQSGVSLTESPVRMDVLGAESVKRDEVVELQLETVFPNKNQPRSRFEEEPLESLAASIRDSGVMQPIVVRVRAAGGFEIIAGERRWRASKIAGRETVPAVVREADDQLAAQWAMIENIQREDLNPIEKAMGFQRLGDQFGLTQQEIADRVGIGRVSVANTVRLLDLDEQTQAMIVDGLLSGGHGKALLQCKDTKARTKLARKAATEGWTVRTLEKAASVPAKRTQEKKESEPGLSATDKRVGLVLADLEQQLGEYLGTGVSLKTSKGGTRGRVQIEFYDLDHFDGLMSRIGFSPKES